MKKFLSVLVVLCMLFALTACVTETPAPPDTGGAGGGNTGDTGSTDTGGTDSTGDTGSTDTGNTGGGNAGSGGDEPVAPAEAFPGKIAVVTNTIDQNEEEYRSAEALIRQYGDKVIHRTWPVNFSNEGEMMISILQEIARDPEVHALIINQAVLNTNAAVDKFRELRDDVFIVFCSPAENTDDSAARADLVLMPDELKQGETIVMQAKALGATTLAHYSFARHMSVPLLAARRDLMRQFCEREGIIFEDLTAPDPTGDVGMPGAQLFITQDVPKQVDRLGKDTAFYSTNCGMQIPLIAAVIDTGAIYPQPCCPSPYHGFPSALGITSSIPTGVFNEDGEELMDFRNLNEVVAETKAFIAAKGMSGRLSTWPVPGSMLWTYAGFHYAVEWINGNVPKEFGVIDMGVLMRIMDDYIVDACGESIPVIMEPYDLDGVRYEHFLMGLVDYLTY